MSPSPTSKSQSNTQFLEIILVVAMVSLFRAPALAGPLTYVDPPYRTLREAIFAMRRYTAANAAAVLTPDEYGRFGGREVGIGSSGGLYWLVAHKRHQIKFGHLIPKAHIHTRVKLGSRGLFLSKVLRLRDAMKGTRKTSRRLNVLTFSEKDAAAAISRGPHLVEIPADVARVYRDATRRLELKILPYGAGEGHLGFLLSGIPETSLAKGMDLGMSEAVVLANDVPLQTISGLVMALREPGSTEVSYRYTSPELGPVPSYTELPSKALRWPSRIQVESFFKLLEALGDAR